GGIRTPDTVARMPHFECGAFNHSATSPDGANRLKRVAQYLAAESARDKSAWMLCSAMLFAECGERAGRNRFPYQ
ncbi:MAG: hypothetical protein WBF47_11485, partial [Xanthobacteraceae bacterium]